MRLALTFGLAGLIAGVLLGRFTMQPRYTDQFDSEMYMMCMNLFHNLAACEGEMRKLRLAREASR